MIFARPAWLLPLFACVVLLSACGSAPTASMPEATGTLANPPTAALPSPTAAWTPAPPAPGAITSLEDAQQALIRIRSKGQFLDPPGVDTGRVSGRGSGFIIDPSGMAVTNHHVVTGAQDVTVSIGSDLVTQYPARVLGVSVCHDLAVLDIEGDGFPYLAWSTEPLEFGQGVTVGGFSLQEAGVSLSRGMLVDDARDGSTPHTSVDRLLEYTARASAGLSGGPILGRDGAIQGIHLGSFANLSGEGLAAQDARDVVEQIAAEGSLDTLGLNVQVVSDESGGLQGVWVSAVQPGTSALAAGLQPGDVITSLMEVDLTQDQTLATYCGILQQAQPGDSLSFEAYRPATAERLEGAIDAGGIPLAPTPTPTLKPRLDGILNPQASQPGDLYFRYEFTDDLAGLEPFFTSGEPDQVSWEVNDGALNLEFLSQHTYTYFINQELTTADVRLDIRSANLGENNNYVSLVCRYSGEGWYEFSVSSNGLYQIYRYDPTLTNPYRKLADGGSFDIRMGREENDFTATCQGDSLSLYINNTLVRTVTNNELESGQVGFSVASLDRPPVIVAIDQFSASVPDE